MASAACLAVPLTGLAGPDKRAFMKVGGVGRRDGPKLLGRIVGLPDKSYKKECQEKYLPFGSVPILFRSRHSAQLFERALSMREWSSSGLMFCYASACEAEKRFLSPVVPFHCRDGAIRFLKRTSLTVIH